MSIATADVAIIGGGIVGAACARALAREKLHVVLIEASDLEPLHLDSACFWQNIFHDMRCSQYPQAFGGALREVPTFRVQTCLVPATPG